MAKWSLLKSLARDMQQRRMLKLLTRDVLQWNVWRRQHPLTLIDLSRANLSRANLVRANLSRADLVRADLSEANLIGADLVEADLRGADLRGANLSEANLIGADLGEANLGEANLSEADLSRAIFEGVDLSRAIFEEVDLRGVDLSTSELLYFKHRETHLSEFQLHSIEHGEAGHSKALLSQTDHNSTVTSASDPDLFGSSQKDVEAPTGESAPSDIPCDHVTSRLVPPDLLTENPAIFPISGEEGAGRHFQPIHLLYCYTPQDREFRDRLETHLMVLKRLKQITLRLNREILAGTNWKEVQDARFHQADLILLLISPDFIASDYHYGTEMRHALEKHKANHVCVIPILMRPIAFWQQTPLGALQVLPQNGKAITEHPERDQDQVFVEVVTRIGEVASRLLRKKYPFLQAVSDDKVTQALGPFCASCGARNPPDTLVCENCRDVLL